jgi:hypothetical protein
MSARVRTFGRTAFGGHRLAVVMGGMALAVMIAATARIATGFGRTYSYLVPSAGHGFPDWMRGPLAGLGSPLSRHGFVILLAATSVAFVVALAVAPRLPVWLAATAIAVLVTICALAPPLLSTDVFNYVAYARMGVRGINPYAHGTIAFRGDPSYPFVGHFWNHTPTAYGPPFTLFSYCLAPLGVAGAMWAFKAIAAVATLACVALTWSCARMLGREPMRAALLVGLNPLVLIFGVGGGHNDAHGGLGQPLRDEPRQAPSPRDGLGDHQAVPVGIGQPHLLVRSGTTVDDRSDGDTLVHEGGAQRRQVV